MMLSVASSRIQALLMLGTSASWLRTWASFCMPSGCVLLDAMVAVRGGADIVQCQRELRKERCTSLHMLNGTSQFEVWAFSFAVGEPAQKMMDAAQASELYQLGSPPAPYPTALR